MTVTRRTPQFDALRSWVTGLGGRWVVVPEVSEHDRDKLAWLAARERDLLKITPDLERAVASAIQADIAKTLTAAGNLRTDNTLRAIAGTLKAAVLGRIAAQGGDVTLAALSGAYRAYKRRRGLDPRIAVATGQLLRALRAARFLLVRR